MKKIRHSEEQIIAILKEQEQGLKVAEVCRKHGIAEPTFYNWKKRYSGMNVDELRKLKTLEYENAQLKRMFANLSLEHEAVKELLEKKF